MKDGNPLGVLQAKLAEHAAELLSNNLINLKDLVSMIQSLEGTRGGENDGSAERALQSFLRGEDPEPETPRGTVQ